MADFPVPLVFPLFLNSLLHNEVSQVHSSFLMVAIF